MVFVLIVAKSNTRLPTLFVKIVGCLFLNVAIRTFVVDAVVRRIALIICPLQGLPVRCVTRNLLTPRRMPLLQVVAGRRMNNLLSPCILI